jgi:uncharacterized membrane protein YgdD (TMEM256/DUF423 family)
MNRSFYKILLATSAAIGCIGVMIGAFGAHFLKSRLESADLEIVRTGVLYLFIHVLALLVIALLVRNDTQSRLLKGTGVFFVIGIIFFSGSLFLIATQALIGINTAYIVLLTPLGGLCFILGWIFLFSYALTERN